MKTSTIIFTLVLFLTVGLSNDTAAQQSKTVVTQSLYNPSDFKVMDHSRLLVTDNATDFPVYLVDMETDKILSKIQRGKGPGELSGMYKNISITADYIFVWDYGRQRLNYYDHNLQHKGSKSFTQLGYIYNVVIASGHVLIIDDSTLFVKIFDYDKHNILGVPIASISISDHKSFEQFEHTPLRQAFKVSTGKEGFYIANEFTSIVFFAGQNGLAFVTADPLNVIQDNREGVYDATDLLYNALCSLDIEAEAQKIYVLSKGEKANRSVISKEYNNQINKYLEDFINTNRIFVYNKQGAFLEENVLETPVKKIHVYDGKLYYLQTREGMPSIGYYSL